jgi:hypothetical protein
MECVLSNQAVGLISQPSGLVRSSLFLDAREKLISGGDTVGVGVDFTTGRAFFTKNGALIGIFSPSHRLEPL